MNPLSKAGATIVIFALAAYTVAVVTEQRARRVRALVLLFLTLGVMLDVTATVFMILGSSKGAFTLHGALGYSSLAGMLIDTVCIWRFRLANPEDVEIPGWLHRLTRGAYLWWLVAFVSGGLLVALR